MGVREKWVARDFQRWSVWTRKILTTDVQYMSKFTSKD